MYRTHLLLCLYFCIPPFRCFFSMHKQVRLFSWLNPELPGFGAFLSQNELGSPETAAVGWLEKGQILTLLSRVLAIHMYMIYTKSIV